MPTGVYVRSENQIKLMEEKLYSKSRNKTYEEMYGIEKAEEILNKISINSIGKHKLPQVLVERTKLLKDKTYEESYGGEKAKEMRKNISETRKKLFKEGKLVVSEETRKKLSDAKSRENNHNWNNGSSFEPYPITFNKAFKLAIRQRDGFLCLKCGMREEDSLILFKRVLAIHHIDYIYENTISENCCALCHRCNNEVNANRPSWQKFFQSMLSERYEYKYSENGDIILELNNLRENN